MKSIVTGGAGFIGSNLAEYLLEQGHEVHVIDDLSAGKQENVPEGATLHELDVRDTEKLTPIFKNADYVFHLAANPRVQDSIDNPIETQAINVGGTLSVLTAAKEAGVKKFVQASTCAAYGDREEMPVTEEGTMLPLSPYGLHKLVCEHECRLWSYLYGLPTVSLRYFNVYGPKFDPYGAYPLVIGLFLEKIKNGEPLTITGDGTNTRDYVHVYDIARANLLAAESDCKSGEVMNIGTGTETSVLEIAEIIGGDIKHIEPRIEPKRFAADNSRAKKLIGWEPTMPFKEGVEKLKEEYLS